MDISFGGYLVGGLSIIGLVLIFVYSDHLSDGNIDKNRGKKEK